MGSEAMGSESMGSNESMRPIAPPRTRKLMVAVSLLWLALVAGCQPEDKGTRIDGSTQLKFMRTMRAISKEIAGTPEGEEFERAIAIALDESIPDLAELDLENVASATEEGAELMKERYRQALDGLTVRETIAKYRSKLDAKSLRKK